jgi:hypothetical protein
MVGLGRRATLNPSDREGILKYSEGTCKVMLVLPMRSLVPKRCWGRAGEEELYVTWDMIREVKGAVG